MAWLPMYLLGADRELVVERFNEDRSVAWLVSAGASRWRAVGTLEQLPAPRIGLWHVPSGPLPLVAADPREPAGAVSDPWAGWTELRDVGRPEPYFGPGHPGVYWLTIRDTPPSSPIRLSGLEWIGNHYASIGRPAPAETERHWRAVRRWANRVGVRVPTYGPLDAPWKDAVAFPAAFAAMHGGRARNSNPV